MDTEPDKSQRFLLMSDRKDITLAEDQMIQSGGRLLSKLQNSGVKMDAAFLIKNAAGAWRLNIVTSHVMTEGPRSLLKTVAKTLESLDGFSKLELYDVDVISPQNPDVVALLGVMPHGQDNRMSHNTFDEKIVEDLHVYFSNTEKIVAMYGH